MSVSTVLEPRPGVVRADDVHYPLERLVEPLSCACLGLGSNAWRILSSTIVTGCVTPPVKMVGALMGGRLFASPFAIAG